MTTNKDEKKHAEPTFCQFGSNSRPGHKRMPSGETVRNTYPDIIFNERCGDISPEHSKAAFRPALGHTFYYLYGLSPLRPD